MGSQHRVSRAGSSPAGWEAGLPPCRCTWPVLSCLRRHCFPKHGPAFTFSSLHSRTVRTSDTCHVSDKPVAGKSPKEPRSRGQVCRRVPKSLQAASLCLTLSSATGTLGGTADVSNRLCSWTGSQTDTGSEQRPLHLCGRPLERSGAEVRAEPCPLGARHAASHPSLDSSGVPLGFIETIHLSAPEFIVSVFGDLETSLKMCVP